MGYQYTHVANRNVKITKKLNEKQNKTKCGAVHCGTLGANRLVNFEVRILQRVGAIRSLHNPTLP